MWLGTFFISGSMSLFRDQIKSKYRFFSLGSGSSGNCYYLGNQDYGILIDAGVGIRKTVKTLREFGVSLDKIKAVLVTHDHTDHIKIAGCLAIKYCIPIYATEPVHAGIRRNKFTQGELYGSRKIIEKECPFLIEDFSITAFDVPHDTLENVGYQIKFDDQIFVLLTDVGRITPTLYKYAQNANHLVMEANYDHNMLSNGHYPTHLKERIANGMGHISNDLCAEFIRSIYHPALKNIWLCHLSQDNNKPELAFQTVAIHLAEVGAKVNENVSLETLSRYKASGLKEL